MSNKFFTPKEANLRLPLIRRIVDDILNHGQRLKILSALSPEVTKGDYQKVLEEMEKLMNELESLGCTFKDWNFEIGLVDFPAVIDGEEVLLCWKSDEKAVRWYHGYTDGYSGRQLIPEKLLTE